MESTAGGGSPIPRSAPWRMSQNEGIGAGPHKACVGGTSLIVVWTGSSPLRVEEFAANSRPTPRSRSLKAVMALARIGCS